MSKFLRRIFSAAIAALLLVSCSGGAKPRELSERITREPLKLCGIKPDCEIQSAAAYKNIVFILSKDEILRYDILTGENAAFGAPESAEALGCDGSCLAVVCRDEICIYGYEGEELDNIPLDTPTESVSAVAVRNNSIAFSVSSGKSSDILLADIEKKTVAVLPDTWQCGARNASLCSLGFGAKGDIRALISYNGGIAGSDYKEVGYDPEKDEITLENVAESYASDGCFGENGMLYYPQSFSSDSRTNEPKWNQFISELSDGGGVSNVMLVDCDGLKKLGIAPKNFRSEDITDAAGTLHVFINSDAYSLLYADGESFVLLDETAGTFAGFSTDTGLESLVVAIPASTSPGYKLWITDYIKQMSISYTSKTGRPVLIYTVEPEEYGERMRTKLLAGDSDFDLFIAESDLLSGILENSAFYPLDGFEDICHDFDSVLAEGVKELMTTDGGLFGVPLKVSYWGCLSEVEESGIPQSWTFEEMFEFCDGMPKGKKIFGDRYMLSHSVKNIIEDMLTKDKKVDVNELSQILAKIREYNDRGLLCDGDNEPYLTYGMLGFDPMSLKTNEYTGARTVLCPTRSGTNYIDLTYTLIMNRASKNAEAGAEFLEMFTSEEHVYRGTELESFIGRDVEKNICWGELDEPRRENLRSAMNVYKDSKPSRTGALEEFTAFYNDELFRLLDGAVTPDEAAQALADKTEYLYFE